MLFIQLGNMAQAFDSFLKFHKGAEVSHAHDLAGNGIADFMAVEPVFPEVGFKLFYAKRQLLVYGINA